MIKFAAINLNMYVPTHLYVVAWRNPIKLNATGPENVEQLEHNVASGDLRIVKAGDLQVALTGAVQLHSTTQVHNQIPISRVGISIFEYRYYRNCFQ